MENGKLVVGLLAHVDAGKTTLSEAMLYLSGAVRKLGRVDHRDAFLDTDVQERERGITIFSKQAELEWKGKRVVLMDTPGHVDFSSEMERVLGVLDAAVLVISGADGVQAHTRTLYGLLKKHRLPVFLFINKMDQPGTDRRALLDDLKKKLGGNFVDMRAENVAEEIAVCSEEALNSLLETGSIPQTEIDRLTRDRLLFPCYFGAALKMDGIEALLNGLAAFDPKKKPLPGFGARVYKIARDEQGNRLTYLRITGGTLSVRDSVSSRKEGTPAEEVREEKINQIRFYSGSRFRTADTACFGDVCAVTGLTFTRCGQGLGMEKDAEQPELTPVFTYQVLLPTGFDPHTALKYMRILEEEDPQLHVVWKERSREIHVQLMGEVQLEILSRLLMDRFHLAVRFGEGSILYRETIENTVEGVGHYEPLRHYAEVHLLLEKGKRGSGIHVSSSCSLDDLDINWQRLIMTHVMEKPHLGVLTGSPLTDVKITLLAGRAHLKHTEGGDFRQATYRAIRQGLMQAKSTLLEPWYDLRLQLPAENLGRAMNDLTQMGGQFDPAETVGDEVILTAGAPVARCRHYAREVAAYTKGRGQVQMTLRGYEPCQEQDRLVKLFGYDPEADIENTPDSVFCSHGAGFAVKWDRVPEYMHIDTGILKAKKPPQGTETPAAHTPYRGTAEEDKELMAIFERTYGPIKPRGFQPVSKMVPPTHQQVYQPPEDEYLLVDGYNMIFAWEELKKTAAWNLEAARRMLMDILCNYRGVRSGEVILVFDAYKVPGSPGVVEKYNNITVVYTKEAQTADSYIEKATYDIGKKHKVRVATSDGLEQAIILGNGALRVPASEFHREVEQADAEIRQLLDALARRKFPAENIENALKDAWARKQKAAAETENLDTKQNPV